MYSTSRFNATASHNGMNSQVKINFFDVESSDFTEYLTIPLNLNDNLFAPMHDWGSSIITNSWGGGAGVSYGIHSYYTDEFMFEHPDALVLFAASNDGEYGNYTVSAQGSGKNCLTVGATLTDKHAWDSELSFIAEVGYSSKFKYIVWCLTH